MVGGIAFPSGDHSDELSLDVHSRIVSVYREVVLVKAKGARAIQHQVLRSQNWDSEVIEVGPEDKRWASLPSGSAFIHPLALGPARARPSKISILMRAVPLSIIESGLIGGLLKGVDKPNEWGLLRAIGYTGP